MELSPGADFTEQDARSFMRECNLDPDEWTLEDTRFGPHGGQWKAKHKVNPSHHAGFFWYGSDSSKHGYFVERIYR